MVRHVLIFLRAVQRLYLILSKKLYQLDENLRIFLCPDYLSEGRLEYNSQSSIQTQKSTNIHINVQTIKAELVEMRNRRDATLSMPKIILPAIQINMDGADFLNLKQTEFII